MVLAVTKVVAATWSLCLVYVKGSSANRHA
jgi:hypothetical protein